MARSKLEVVVGIARREGGVAEREVRVSSLDKLYAACREAPPTDLVRVSLFGPEGEVRLNFASFIRKGA